MAATLLYFKEFMDLLKFDLLNGLTLLLIVLFFDFYLDKDQPIFLKPTEIGLFDLYSTLSKYFPNQFSTLVSTYGFISDFCILLTL